MQGRKILFIIIDQLRADCIHGALADHVDLPNIAAFRHEATTFLRHYSVTNPCGPSRASILTGLYAMNHRSVRNGTPLSAGHTNLATELRKSGYDPLLFGYTDTSHDPRTGHPRDPRLLSYEGVLPGFHEIVEMCLDQSYPWRAHLAKKGYDLPEYRHFYDPVPADPNRPARPDDPSFYRAEDSDTAFLTDAFLDQMAVRTDHDWCALLTYIRPHPPLVAPAPFNHLVNPADLPLPTRHADIMAEEGVHPFMASNRQRPTMASIIRATAVDETNDEDVQMLRAIYLGLAAEVDHHIGRIIRFLKDSGQYDDTLIVLTADHGEMLGDHHMWGKQQVYEAAYHVPLIIRDPEHSAGHGQSVVEMTESTDVMPTILEACGQSVPPALDGASLGGFLRGSAPRTWKKRIMLELDFGEPDQPTPLQQQKDIPLAAANLAILHEGQFKLVHFNAGLPPLLFDLTADPGEMVNLADDPAHQATLLHMTRRLLNHRMQHADQNLAQMQVRPDGVLNGPS